MKKTNIFLSVCALTATLFSFQNCGDKFHSGSFSTLNNSEEVDVEANQAPTVSAGEDKTLNLPANSTSLSAMATDSDGTIVQIQWMQMSGPNTATLSGQNTTNLSVSGLASGSYVFRVLATDDSGNSRVDEVSVFVNPAGNTAPVVNAGADQSLQLPINNINLTGTATDNEGVSQIIWSQVSGPGSPSISSPNALITSITGLLAGTYVFQLRAVDAMGATTVDTVQVIVAPAPIIAPVCNALTPGANINGANLIYDPAKTAMNFASKTTTNFICPPPPAAPSVFNPPSYYITGTTTVNPASETHMRPFSDFADKLNELGDLYVQSQDPVVASCTLRWLSAWSSSTLFNEYIAPGSLNYTITRGDYERAWFVGIWLLNMAKVINAPGLSSTQIAAVRTWMGRSMNPIMAFYNNRIRYIDGVVNRPENLNNLQYRAGLSVMLYGVLFNSATHTNWGLIQYRLGVDSIRADGTLATEMAAGANAYIYHIEALQPLILMAEIQTLRGNNLYTYNNSRLSLLASMIASSYTDFTVFSSKTTVAQSQTPSSLMTGRVHYYDWLEFWHSRFNRPDFVPLIRQARANSISGRIKNYRSGGDITASWGVGTCRL